MATVDQALDLHEATVDGDGGNAPVTKEELTKFKGEVEEIARAAAYNVNERRFASEEVRFTIWEGRYTSRPPPPAARGPGGLPRRPHPARMHVPHLPSPQNMFLTKYAVDFFC